MRAVVYTRISRDVTGKALGVARQEADCLELIEREGHEHVATFTDNDLSAYSGKPRPGYDDMRDLLRADGADVLVAWHPDRITRQPRELEDLIDQLDQTHTTVQTVEAGEWDLTTPSGRMTARVLGAVARHESEHKSKRIKRKHQELADAGELSGGGTRPFGYEQDRMTVRESEAIEIRQLVAKVLAGASIRSLAIDLNQREIRTTTDRDWLPVSLKRCLMSARIAGMRSHKGKETLAVWPAIIPPEEHRRIVAVLSDPKRKKGTGSRKYLLTGGTGRCGLCGEALIARSTGSGERGYACGSGPGQPGCGKIRALAEGLEELVSTAVIRHVREGVGELAATPRTDDSDEIDAELETIETRRAELGEMFAAGEIDRAGWRAASDALDKRATAAADKLTDVASDSLSPDVVDFADRWEELTFEERKSVVVVVVETVTVGPAVKGRNFFDPSRVSITWRE
jgi:site-specific DNA recombinase